MMDHVLLQKMRIVSRTNLKVPVLSNNYPTRKKKPTSKMAATFNGWLGVGMMVRAIVAQEKFTGRYEEDLVDIQETFETYANM